LMLYFTTSCSGVWTFQSTKEPYQDVIWATRGGFLRHKRRSSVPKTHHEMVWSPQPACT